MAEIVPWWYLQRESTITPKEMHQTFKDPEKSPVKRYSSSLVMVRTEIPVLEVVLVQSLWILH